MNTPARMTIVKKPKVIQGIFCDKITQSVVDQQNFYTIKCHKTISQWIRQQPNQNVEWFEHIDGNWTLHTNIFDVSEEFYILLRLQWGV